MLFSCLPCRMISHRICIYVVHIIMLLSLPFIQGYSTSSLVPGTRYRTGSYDYYTCRLGLKLLHMI